MQNSTINRSDTKWQLLDSLQTSVFLLEGSLHVRFLNESAEVLVGDSLGRNLGKHLTSIFVEAFSDNQLQALARACDATLQTRSVVKLYDLELLVPTVQKTCLVDCDVSCFFEDEEVLILLEIHENKQINLNVANSDQIKRKQSIIRGFAHEIRNPLGGIRGAAQLLQSDLKDAVLTEYTDVIIHEADRLSRLVERMHATASVNSRQVVNIHLILEHVHRLVRSEFGDVFEMNYDYDPSLPDIACDEDQLVQAILNIARNAIQATSHLEAPGVITFRSRIDRIVGEEDRQVQVVRVDVEDNGVGIESEILPHVFEPMVTTRSSGTGLGLSITSEIIRAHDGVLTAKSESGSTTFSLYLPTLKVGESV